MMEQETITPQPPTEAATRSPGKPAPSIWTLIVRFLGSYGLAVALMALLFVLTFLGTLEQGSRSLYDVQVDYFESIIHIYWIELGTTRIPLLLPGAYILLILFAVNLIVGGLIRIRKSSSTAGVIVAHLGILFLLFGGLVEFLDSDKGHMTIHEAEPFEDTNANGVWDPNEAFTDANQNGRYDAGETSNEFMSYYDWEVVITEYLQDGRLREHVIQHDVFAYLDKGETARATSEVLPFDVVMLKFMRNARPYRVADTNARRGERVGLEEVDPDAEKAERNLAGLTVQLVPPDGTRAEALVWGGQNYPARVEVLGRKWDVDLRHKRWELPFDITLDDFQKEQHAGTRMAKRFSSFVTKTEDDDTTTIHITMNEPLRHSGYTLYQSGWGPPDAPEGARLYSTFSVVRNPADKIPEYACWVIAFGLLVAFTQKLVRYIRTQQRRTA